MFKSPIMRTSSTCAAALLFVVFAGACGEDKAGPTYHADPVGTAGAAPNAGSANGGSGQTGTGGSGAAVITAGTGGASTGTAGTASSAGTGAVSTGGSSTGGAAPTAGSGGGGAALKGHFKMLVYEETRGYPHPSIKEGNEMLQAMATANDFEVVMSDGDQTAITNDPQITAADLAPFDMVFFMNPTGDIFGSDSERDIFKVWLKDKKSFAGVHSTTDTEHNNAWYEDLVGEIYTDHTSENLPSASVIIEEAAKNHPAVAGLQSPWTRNEEWYRFLNGRVSGGLPGLTVLLRFAGPTPTKGPAVGQPISWVRCWEGVRSFYTAMGHDGSAYKEADFKKHVLNGLLWAARRVNAPNETCP